MLTDIIMQQIVLCFCSVTLKNGKEQKCLKPESKFTQKYIMRALKKRLACSVEYLFNIFCFTACPQDTNTSNLQSEKYRKISPEDSLLIDCL